MLSAAPAIRGVELVGSRAEGRAHDQSDWDFIVRTDDFASVAAALPGLLAPFEPLAAQWDRLSDTECFMLILPGPVKVDLIFPDQPHQPEPPWQPTRENLVGIDRHFWDWTLWLAGKEAGGKRESLSAELEKLFQHLLAPLGAEAPPTSVADAVSTYLRLRDALERRFEVEVPRVLERAALPSLAHPPHPARAVAPQVTSCCLASLEACCFSPSGRVARGRRASSG